jgi:hypothetical protein
MGPSGPAVPTWALESIDTLYAAERPSRPYILGPSESEPRDSFRSAGHGPI